MKSENCNSYFLILSCNRYSAPPHDLWFVNPIYPISILCAAIHKGQKVWGEKLWQITPRIFYLSLSKGGSLSRLITIFVHLSNYVFSLHTSKSSTAMRHEFHSKPHHINTSIIDTKIDLVDLEKRPKLSRDLSLNHTIIWGNGF